MIELFVLLLCAVVGFIAWKVEGSVLKAGCAVAAFTAFGFVILVIVTLIALWPSH